MDSDIGDSGDVLIYDIERDCLALAIYTIVCIDKILTHRIEILQNLLDKCFIQQLKDSIYAIEDVHFRNFERLLQGSLFKFDDELLIHAKNGNPAIRVRTLCEYSHEE